MDEICGTKQEEECTCNNTPKLDTAEDCIEFINGRMAGIIEEFESLNDDLAEKWKTITTGKTYEEQKATILDLSNCIARLTDIARFAHEHTQVFIQLAVLSVFDGNEEDAQNFCEELKKATDAEIKA